MGRPKTCNFCNERIKAVDNIYPKNCPYCGKALWDKSPDEILLHDLQDKYVDTKSEEDFGNFLIAVKLVLRNIILGKLKGSGYIVQDDELDDLILDSLEKVIKLYKKPNFYITDSFVGYFQQVVLYPMYNPKKKDYQQNEISYNTPIKDNTEKEEKTLLNYLEEMELSHDMDKTIYQDKLIEELLSLVEAFYLKTCEEISPKAGYVLLFALKEFFNNKKDTYFYELFNRYDTNYYSYFEKFVILIKNFIIEYEKESFE